MFLQNVVHKPFHSKFGATISGPPSVFLHCCFTEFWNPFWVLMHNDEVPVQIYSTWADYQIILSKRNSQKFTFMIWTRFEHVKLLRILSKCVNFDHCVQHNYNSGNQNYNQMRT